MVERPIYQDSTPGANGSNSPGAGVKIVIIVGPAPDDVKVKPRGSRDRRLGERYRVSRPRPGS